MTEQPIDLVLGGVVDPQDLVGRDDEIERLVRAVAHGGSYVVGDRRMGKTSILRKARVQLEDAGNVVLYVSAETGDLSKFESALEEAITSHPVFAKPWRQWTASFDGEVRLSFMGQGASLKGSLKRSASARETDVFVLCAKTAEDVGASAFVVFVDEVAQLAFHLDAKSPGEGAEFLRTLRRLRQLQHPRMAVVLAGSVGLHHAVADATSLNDLPRIEVGPLPIPEAEELARRLMLAVYGEPHPVVATRIAAATSGIPFYIQSVIGALEQSYEDPASVDIAGLVDESLDSNAWDTDHYYDRIAKYYPDDQAAVVALLDVVSESSRATRHELSERVGNVLFESPPSLAEVGELLNNLRLDNYLSYHDGEFAMATEFLRKIWTRLRLRRG